jgi:KDO2-lipid IV(A) lauroyltransferase
MPKRRRIAVENVLKCGIASDEKEARRIAKKSFCHLAGHIGEALFVPSVVNKENWREHLDFAGTHPDIVKLLLDSPDTPIILVSSHHGVWEAATNVLSFARPMIAVARTMNNSWVARWMKKHHFRGPVTVIDKSHGFTGAVMRQWKTENAAMTILMDQHAGKKHGAKLMFFGRPAWTFTTGARMGVRTGCGIVVGSFVRVAPFMYRLVGGAPVYLKSGDDIAKATQLLNDRLEDAIRRYPEQYLWVHRRWRE